MNAFFLQRDIKLALKDDSHNENVITTDIGKQLATLQACRVKWNMQRANYKMGMFIRTYI